MRRQLTASLIFVWLCTAAFAAFQSAQWKEYEYPADGFAISAPAKPVSQDQQTSTVIGQLQSHTYMIELGGDAGVVVSVTDFGKGPNVNAKEMLQGAKEGSLKSTNSKLVSEKEILLDGNPGLEFDFEASAYHGHARYYIVRGRLLALMSIAPATQPIAPVTGKIFDSLRLLKAAG